MPMNLREIILYSQRETMEVMSKLKVPNTYVIIFAVLLISAISTWFVKGGEAQTWQVFSALYEGFSQQAGIIAFVLLTGVITAAFSMAGIRIGNIFGSRFRKPSEITGGLILMLMGINILLQHILG